MGLPENDIVKLDHKYPKGNKNKITDVPGVKVGHVTLNDQSNNIHTGVTAVLPHERNLFKEKTAAGVSIINGFGKSAGLVQIEEMGTIESPIIMTNTFGVGTALNASVKYMLDRNEDIGVDTCTVNCIVTECNDGTLNDIRGMHVTEKDVLDAIDNASSEFEEGAVGGGTGMCCMGIKGGIGTASRIIEINNNKYSLGTILMSNFGVAGNLRINGKAVSSDVLSEISGDKEEKDKGSVIVVIATDVPLTSRQLKRVAKRASIGLGRAGSYLGNGSGDIAIAFSTANIIPHYNGNRPIEIRMISDDCIDKVFEAVVETVEESVISSLYHSHTVKGIRNKTVFGLLDMLEMHSE